MADAAPAASGGHAAPASSVVGRGVAPARHHLLLAVFIGGTLGTSIRAGLEEVLPHAADAWPWATLIVNAAGCLLLGWLTAGLLLGGDLDPRIHPLLATGLCGGLTTFSTFQVELLRMLDAGAGGLAAAYAAASIVVGVGAVLAGRVLARRTHPPGAVSGAPSVASERGAA